MSPDDLLKQAEHLCHWSSQKPRQADLRRAVSAAYYAVFHELCHACANTLIGTAARSTEAWVLAYRAVDHGTAKKRCKSLPGGSVPRDLATFAKAFVSLQEQRHRADYAPDTRYAKSETLQHVGTARRAVAAMRAADR